MNQVLEKLSGGDLRAEGRAEEVAGEIINHPRLLMDLAEGLHHDDKLIRGRACMTMEVISRDHPGLLVDVVPQLIELASTDTVPQVRWHVAEIFRNVALSDEDAERTIPTLLGYLADKSKIVKYCAVQALGVLGRRSPLRGEIVNRISALSSQYTSFDPVDYHSIMETGGCAIMGLTKVNKFQDKFAISEAVKKNLQKTLLAGGFDLSTAKVAGCIVVGGKGQMKNVSGLQDNINYAFDVLSEITGKATIHRGIYEDGRECLRVYTIIGGLESPVARLQELRSCMTVEAR